jgi:hypothetical protein
MKRLSVRLGSREERHPSGSAGGRNVESGGDVAVAYLETGRRLLVAGLAGAERDRVERSVAPYRHQLTTALEGWPALELARCAPFDALIVAHPVTSPATQAFLSAVRAPDSACRHAGLVLLAPERRRDDAESYIGRGANRVVSLERVEESLPEALGPLLRVKPRHRLNASVRVELVGEKQRRRVFGETVNVSVSGMLVRLPYSLPAGTAVRFEVFLRQGAPLTGYGAVVRQSRARVEPYPGVGLAFFGFDADGEASLAKLLERRAD